MGILLKEENGILKYKKDAGTYKAAGIDPAVISNVLTDVVAGKVLDARQGKILNDLITGLKAGSTETIASLKASVDTLNALVTGNTPDGDSVVNTIQELLAVFSAYPEGADIATLIAGKLNTSTYNTNRTADQAVMATAQTTANEAQSRTLRQRVRGSWASKKIVAYGGQPPISSDQGLNSTSTVTEVVSRKHFKAVGNVSDLSVIWANALTQGKNVAAGASITITAAIEFTYTSPDGLTVTPSTKIPILFNGGSATAVLAWGQVIQSDPLYGIEIPDGADFWIRTKAVVASGAFWYLAAVTNPSFAEGAITGTGLDINAAIPNSNSFAFFPWAVTGASDSRKGSVLKIGDSISKGFSTDYGTNGPFYSSGGMFGRAFGQAYADFQTSYNGDGYRNWKPYAVSQFAQIFGLCDFFIDEFGINDIADSTPFSLAQIQGNAVSLWDRLMGRGLLGYKTTVTPYTTSTDSWTTTANQTVKSFESKRVAFNDWIRDGSPLDKVTRVAQSVGTTGSNVIRAGQVGHPLLGYFDIADLVETSRNSGIFKVVGGNAITGDGLHFNATGYAIVATGIDLSKFSLW